MYCAIPLLFLLEMHKYPPQTQRITSKLQQYNKITAGHKIKEKTCSGASCVFIFFFRDSIPSYDPDALRPVVTQQLPACLAAR